MSNGKILISALEESAGNAIDKIAGITVDANGRILLSAAAFDSLGSQSSNVYITPTQVKIKSNSFVVDSTNFSLTATGVMTARSGTIGGWSITSSQIASGSSTGFVKLDSDTSHVYAIYCGNETAASAPFRVKRDGSVALTKLLAIGEDNTETEVNLRTAGLWKLNYSTVKSVSTNSITLSNGTTVNFKTAADVTQELTSFSGGWTVTAYLAGEQASTTNIAMPSTATWSHYWVNENLISVTCTVHGKPYTASFSR